MAACALAAARARDGALGHRVDYKESPERSSEIFFAAAQNAIFQNLSHAEGIGFLKACGMLTLASIQYGQIASTQKYLGQFWALAGMQSFHDEDQWPKDISVVEVEERRRLFWSMYNLDIYSTVVFGSMMRVQETHANVSYPSETNDEDLSADKTPSVDAHHWLRGQNFITDLYRILEHIVHRVHRLKPVRNDRIFVTRLLISDGVGDTQVMDSVLALYYGLDPHFKDFGRDLTGDRKNDYYGFMAANIQFTLQLVRMALFSSSVTPDVNEKCAVVEEVLQTFHTISPRYLRAISTPLVYHLGTIGQILASVMNGMLSESYYARVRALLVSLADLLEGLEYGLQPTAGASKGLRKQIDKIDAFMDAQRQLLSSSSLPQHEGMPQSRTGAAFPHRVMDTTVASSEDLDSVHRNSFPTQNSSGSSSNISSLDEFYLPPNLVNQAAWPWPFDLSLGPNNDGTTFPGLQRAGLNQQP
nr:activator of stress genes 1 [Quercus suber]